MVNFLKYRQVCLVSFLFVLVLFSATCFYRYFTQDGSIFNYSVDFTGGTQLLLKFDKSVKGSEISSVLEKHDWKGAITREFSPREFLVRIKEVTSDVNQLGEKISYILEKELDTKINLEQVDSVSSSMGKTLRNNSLYAVVISLILMLFYIALRFRSFAFASGALVALFHDAIVMLTYFLLFNKEITVNVIGAILVVLGYSINDTIVIFSKIRENMKANPDQNLNEVVNRSLNNTLGRTIKTTVSTALVVVSLIVFGGSILSDLSITLLIGIVFGTYSSIYLASPVMLMLYQRSSQGQKAKA